MEQNKQKNEYTQPESNRKATVARKLGRLIGRGNRRNAVDLEHAPTSITREFYLEGGQTAGNIKITEQVSLQPETVVLRTGPLDQDNPPIGLVQILAVPDVEPVADQPVAYRTTLIKSELDASDDTYRRIYVLCDIECVNGRPVRVSEVRESYDAYAAFNNISAYGGAQDPGVKIEIPTGSIVFNMDMSVDDEGPVDSLEQSYTSEDQVLVGVLLQKAGLIAHNESIAVAAPDVQ